MSRKDKIDQKISSGVVQTLPFSLTTIGLRDEENIGMIIRAAVCFGASRVNVIGGLPDIKRLRVVSVSLSDYIEIRQFPDTISFLEHLDEKDDVVCLELTSHSRNINEWSPDRNRFTHVVVGNETLGVPESLLTRFDCFYIPMPGAGVCLNVAQAANIGAFMYLQKSYFHKEIIC